MSQPWQTDEAFMTTQARTRPRRAGPDRPGGLREYGSVNPVPPTAHRLQCHPATPAGLPLALSVAVAVNAGTTGLELTYSVRGDTGLLCIPPRTAGGPADGLWQHTCLEAFVAADGEAAYREFNFSPSGQWAAYHFATERHRDTSNETGHPPSMNTILTPGQLTLNARLPWPALPSRAGALVIALCAVIEERDGRLSYWALQHPQERPDFHHPAGRALRLALPSN